MCCCVRVRSHKKLIMAEVKFCYNLKITHWKISIKSKIRLRLSDLIVKAIEDYVLSLLFDNRFVGFLSDGMINERTGLNVFNGLYFEFYRF